MPIRNSVFMSGVSFISQALSRVLRILARMAPPVCPIIEESRIASEFKVRPVIFRSFCWHLQYRFHPLEERRVRWNETLRCVRLLPLKGMKILIIFFSCRELG